MKRRALVTVTILATLSFVTGATAPTARAQPLAAEEVGSWPMAGANPQRTSWTPEQVSGDLHVEWYRPIDAYIPPHFNVIAANDFVYISSARGLYALRYDSGALVWRYDTDIPLGNSPTIATVNGTRMAFVGGYDKKLHALDAITGQHLWEFTGAKAGYDANPLVINNMVYIGNRDGYFYAVDASNGQLVWQYPAASQDGIGPIHFSPAYKNGVIYFATDYNYAYAISTDGSLQWRSAKLVGDGYNSYWPVIYSENGHDYVILGGSIPYREFMKPGAKSLGENSGDGLLYEDYVNTCGPNPPAVSISEPWGAGKTVIDFSCLTSFYDDKPWRRIYTVLDGANGTEPFYAPIMPLWNPGNQHPVVVNGNDNLIYVDNNPIGSLGSDLWVMGWKFGTSYFAKSPLSTANDEPQVLSSGANLVFRNHKDNQFGDYFSIANLSTYASLWDSGNSLDRIAPGYDEKIYWSSSGNTVAQNYGNLNGIYGYHGVQNPIVPYKGKLFVHRGNSVLAFGPGPSVGKLPLVSSVSATVVTNPVSEAELRSRLEKEIQRVLDAGLLKPGYYTDSGQFACSYYLLDNYFDNPGDTLYTLSVAYQYLSDSLKVDVKNYLKNTIYPRYYQNGIASRIGWKDGVQRDSVSYPPDLAADMQTLDDNYDCCDGSLTWFHPGYMVNPQNYYALWKYAQIVSPEDVQAIYALALEKIGPTWWGGPGGTVVPPSADDATLIREPHQLNAWISGYYGFLKLQELAGKATADAAVRSAITATYDHLHELRLNNFSKDTPFLTYSADRTLNISRNFIWLTPELATDLRNSNLAQVEEAIDEYNAVGPYWFASRFTAAYAESAMQNLYDSPSNFQARAWILNASREELSKWLDVPAFERGDLFYIQNLVAAIEAPPEGPAPTFADVPFSHPYHDVIEVLYQAGYIAGCSASPLMYCPEATMNRAESSVFVERGIHTASYDPPAPTSQVFADMPLDSWAVKWVNGLWQDQYTAGCGTNPLIYCPWQGHTRAEGCVFYLRMMRGASYEPAQPTQQTFMDVPLDAWYAKWVQTGYDAGLLTACQTTPELRFCPNDPLSRALAAYMMVQATWLPPP